MSGVEPIMGSAIEQIRRVGKAAPLRAVPTTPSMLARGG